MEIRHETTNSFVFFRLKLAMTHTGQKIEFNDICLKDKSKTNLMSDLSTHQMSQI